MKFEWIEEGDGRYRVQFFDMDEKKVFDIKITDYSDPYWQQSDLERKTMTWSICPFWMKLPVDTRLLGKCVPYMLMKKSRFCIQKSCNFLTSWKFL